MGEITPTRLWGMRLAYFALALTIVFFHLIPLDTVPRRWAPPDLLMAFTFAWAVRRPEFVPPLSIALAVLLTDFLFQRPPGLMAALVLLAAENLKARLLGPGEVTFAAEWAAVFVAVVGIALAYHLTLVVLAVPTPPLGLTLTQMVLTGVCYPLVVGVTQTVMGIRRSAPGEGGLAGGRAA